MKTSGDEPSKKLRAGQPEAYGFERTDGVFLYRTELCQGQFQMRVTITEAGGLSSELIENESGEAYVLHLVSGATGSFVGGIRAEYQAVLRGIGEQCFEPDVFQSKAAREVIAHVRETYGDAPEFLWRRSPKNAILRRKDTQKWYGALLTVSKDKLGLDGGEPVEILDLRAEPEELSALIDHRRYFPGYHMNKKHWYTVCLDESIPPEELWLRIGESYRLAVK